MRLSVLFPQGLFFFCFVLGFVGFFFLHSFTTKWKNKNENTAKSAFTGALFTACQDTVYDVKDTEIAYLNFLDSYTRCYLSMNWVGKEYYVGVTLQLLLQRVTENIPEGRAAWYAVAVVQQLSPDQSNMENNWQRAEQTYWQKLELKPFLCKTLIHSKNFLKYFQAWWDI